MSRASRATICEGRLRFSRIRACAAAGIVAKLGVMSRQLTILLLALVSQATVIPEERGLAGRAVDQRDFPDSANGCAPATVLNLLRFGGEEFVPVEKALVGSSDAVKMRFLVDRYFRGRPSAVFAGQPRWGAHGVEATDLAAGLRELFEEHGVAPCGATSLERKPDEGEADHLRRLCGLVGDSIAAGVPPILNLRSFHVKRRDENGGEPLWETGVSHYVLVLARRGEPSETGVELEILDPWEARRSVIYLHREANGRDFRALKGVSGSGKWLDGRPFLQVLAPGVPTLRPADVEWSGRYVVVANHLIGRFGVFSLVPPRSEPQPGRNE
jgi:hypothetical protein